jgi:F-type H+-transporting ATPase subunit delta
MNRVGTVYGQGLYALAKEEHLEDSILQELCLLDGAFAEEPDFLKLLSSANLSKQERLNVLDESFRGKVQPYVLNFLMLLTEKGYITQFSACYKAYRQQYNGDKGILQVRAVTAVPMTQAQILRLTEILAGITGKTIDLSCKEDPAVLGGVRLSYDGMEVDGTVQSRLQAMEKRLKNTVL